MGGWGAPFQAAWNAATETAKAGAANVASGAKWVGQQSADAARWMAEKAQAAADKARELAAAAAEKAKALAAEAAAKARALAEQAAAKARALRDAAKEKVRDGIRSVADAGYDGVAKVGEGARQGANTVSSGYRAVKRVFGAGTAGAPVKPCAGTIADGKTDKQRDGMMMAPQGPGKPCATVPPGPKATTQARAKSVQSQSACCKAKRAAGMPPRDIIYVNGISTNSQAHCDTLNAIAEQTCARVVGVYNATEGGAIDAAQTGQDRRLIKAANAGKSVPTNDGRNPAVDTLAQQVSQELRAGRQPEIWAHSQGGAVTSLALSQVRNERAIATGAADPLAGMKVKSFGSAAPSWVDGPQYEHYVHVNDPVPSSFGLGHTGAGDAANAGAGAKVIRFSGDPASPAPFSTNPTLDWVPADIGNHSVDKSYLKMEKQTNGGCP